MKRIEELAQRFRTAIEKAAEAGEADELNFFSRYPVGCCGDASDLLAEFFFANGIIAKYVCGTCYHNNEMQSHAWLLVDDTVIVDITGDQFKFNPIYYNFDRRVYVGASNKFYELFEVDSLRDIHGYSSTALSTYRLKKLYSTIIKYLPKASLDSIIDDAKNRARKHNIKKKENDDEHYREIKFPEYYNNGAR